MALPDIYAAFEAAARDGELTGDAPAGLADLLAALHVDRIAVTGGEATLGPDSAWLVGTTSLLATGWTMTLTGRDDPDHPGRAALTLDLALAGQSGPWTIGQAFDGRLPRTRRAVAGRAGLVLTDSVLGPLVVDEPSVVAANGPPGDPPDPRLRGWLDLEGRAAVPGSDVLRRYAGYLGTPLWLDGAMDLAVAGAPALVLDAVATGTSGDLGKLTLEQVGVRLTTTYPDPAPLPDPGAPTSAVLLFGKLRVPSVPPRIAEIGGPLLTGDHVWPLSVRFDDPLDLQGGIQALMALMDVGDPAAFALPPGIAGINEFGLAQLEFGVVPPAIGGPGITYSSLAITSRSVWDPPVPYLLIDQVGTRWVFDWSEIGPPLVTGSVWGTMTFGAKTGGSYGAMPSFLRRRPDAVAASDDVTATITVRLDLPDLGFVAYNEEPITGINVSDALVAYFGASPPDTPLELTIENVSIEASFIRKTFEAGISITGTGWDVRAGDVTFSLDGMELQVVVTQAQLTGRIQGMASIAVPGQADPVRLLVAAEYPGDDHWTFEGTLSGGPLSLPRFVAAFLGQPPPAWVEQIDVRLVAFSARYTTGPEAPFAVGGTLAVPIGETLLGVAMQLTATALIERRAATTGTGTGMVLAGRLSAGFTVDRFAITAAVSFQDRDKTYAFSVAWRDLVLTATTAWDTTGGTRHQVLTLRLAGTTLGDLVTYLVSLANPNANFRLEPPWDFLNTLDLGRFSLVVDPTCQTIAARYDIALELAFLRLDSVGVRYDRSTGTGRVMFELVGRFLGDTQSRPLQWDAVNQAPPSVPGRGDNLFSLRYLGIGQHVAPKGLTRYTSVTDVLDALVKAMRPVTDLRKVPIDPAKMEFDPSSQWMVGVEATVMGAVTVKLVLHDPDLYGAVLSLRGPVAGSLAGLEVELLYRKVTADIGVFHARLQVPDAFRQLQFGAVAVTLGVLTVDVYTNGDFRVDLGFPHDRDFSVSFAVEAGIFNGRGGLYFGVLSGATSSRVPAVTNGQFSPVIELGVGLSIGVGRTFEKGPLKAGLYVNVLVIFEGALAWFHPDQGGGDTELYYWCRGTAGVVGKLYGSIDFKILAVSVTVEIAAVATLELAAHRATLVALSLSVKANASVKFLFFSVSFQFSLQLSTSFQIGSDSPAPWALASGASARGQLAVAAGAYSPARGRRAAAAASAGLRAAGDGYRLVFDPEAKVFADGQPRTLTVTVAPALTVAGVPVDWSGGGVVPPNADPQYRVAVLLVTESAVPPDAPTVAATWAARTTDEAPFDVAVEAVLRWTLDAFGIRSPDADVTLGDLEALVDQLADPAAETTGFTWENLQGFLANNLHVVLSGPPEGRESLAADTTPFPMLPPLRWTAPDLPEGQRERSFWEHQPVDATYESEALAYFADLDPRRDEDRPSPTLRLAGAGGDDPTESMATFVFRDWFAMVARTAVQAAADLLSAFPHHVEPTDSLAGIAGLFPRVTVDHRVAAGDTVDSLAEHFGLSAAELVALNPDLAERLAAARPGDVLAVVLAVTPEAIAGANPDWPVAPGAVAHLGTLVVQVGAGDTLAGIARTYGADLDAWLAGTALRTATSLLRPGATLALPGFVYPDPGGLGVDTVAAVYFVRLGVDPAPVPYAEWYAEAIVALNPGADITPDGPLPATLLVPSAHLVLDDPGTWRALAGDTLDDVAAYLALVQNEEPGTPFAAWLARVRAANDPAPASGVALPAGAAAPVLAGDTLAVLDDRLLLDDAVPEQAAAFRRLVEGADVLLALSSVTVPGAVVTTGEGLTLVTLAQAYALSLEDLARRVAADAGILATDDDRDLVVPDVPVMGLPALAEAMRLPKPAATVSGAVSRFMLYGLRLPAPEEDGGRYHATGPMTGLYDLVGQQVTGPAPVTPDGDEPEPPVLTITIEKGEAADWLTLSGSVLGDAGRVVPTGDVDAVVLSLTNADLVAGYPATGLVPAVRGALAPLPLSREVQVTHAVTQVTPWQTTDRPLFPSAAPPTAVAPSLWAVPADLRAAAAGGATTSDYVLEQVTPQAGPDAPRTELGAWAWATTFTVAVRRVPGVAGTAEVFGADTADRQRLALLLDYLGAVDGAPRRAAFPPRPAGERATVQLLWQLPPTPGMRPGLTSTPLVTAATYLVQTNLSTETRSGALARRLAAADDPTEGRHFASIADADRFLTLLWECSVVGGGGYWLHYRGDGADVPDSIYDQDGVARLTVLVQLASQSTVDPEAGWPVRKLFAFEDCAVVGDGVDPGSVALVAVARNPLEWRREASAAPGHVGFTLDLANPGVVPADAEGALQQLYSLLGYQLLPTPAFGGSAEGRPVGPQVKTDRDGAGRPVEDEDTWNLTQVVPAAAFAVDRLPARPGAPSPRDDPYAGVTASGTEPLRPVATAVALWFHDVLGNASAPGDGSTSLELPVRYTDPVIGVSAWPSTTTRFDVERRDGAAMLTVAVDLQAVAYQPGAAQRGDAVATRAARDAERFGAAYYQLAQRDVRAALRTTLRQRPGEDPERIEVPVARLVDHVVAARSLLGTVARLGSHHPPAGLTVDGVCTRYGVGHDAVAAADADLPVGDLLDATELAVPRIALLRAGESVADACSAVTPSPDPVVVLEDEDNVVLPLAAGVELRAPDRLAAVPDPSPAVADWLPLLRVGLDRLVARNEVTPALLTPGFVFECNGVQVRVDTEWPASDATLAGVAATFRDAGVPYDTAQVVAVNGDRAGMFRAGAQLVVDGYLAQAGDTLGRNAGGWAPGDLAPLNPATPGLFPQGTPLFLDTVPAPVPAGEPLGRFAADHGVDAGTLLRHNGGVPVADGTSLAVPGATAWPADAAALDVPYTVRSGDRLADVAERFVPAGGDTDPAVALARRNLDAPGTIAGGVELRVGDRTATTGEPVSFAQACALFSPPVELRDLVDAVGGTAGVLAAGALLVCPPGVLPTPIGPAGVTPREAGDRFGVGPVALLGANAGTLDLLLPGQVVIACTPTDDSLPPSETTAERDTLTAVVERFRRRDVAASIESVALANADVPLLRPAATVLVPPGTTRLDGALDDGGTAFPAPVFAVHVEVEVRRSYDLVDPDLRGTREDPDAAVVDRTAVPVTRTPDAAQGGAMTLAAFAASLEAALPALRVATGQVLAERQRAGGTDVWAVVFGPGGVERVAVSAPLTVPGTSGLQPRTFALRPLATTLLARSGVETQLLDPATGELTGQETRSYQGIDLEVWARTFLADVELVLSPAYVTGAYAANRPALDDVIAAKKDLAGAVARGLDAVLEGDRPGDDQRRSAVEALTQQLLVSLARGYDTSAVLQYDAEVASPWDGTYARLSGTPVPTFASADPALQTATVSSGKVSLVAGRSTVELLVYVPDVAAHASLEVTLDYHVVELEFGIERETDGYERSDWLTFVNPVGSGSPAAVDVALGTPDVPLPLRAYPPMPTLVDHSAEVPTTAERLEDALHWRYQFSMRHQSATQDEIGFEVTFNTTTGALAAGLGDDDLFSALAQYTAVSVPLLGILSGLTAWDGAGEAQRAVMAAALGTYRDLVARVAAAWGRHWGPLPGPGTAAAADGGGPLLDVYAFAVTLATDESATWYRTLRLDRTAVQGPGGVGWPDVACVTPDGARHVLQPVGPEACGCGDGDADGCRCYVFTDEVPAFVLLTFELTFPPVHVAAYQNAVSRVWVTRNARLLGAAGPPTATGFVYRTPDVGYREPVVPFIAITDRLQIGDWPADPATGNPLVPFFDAVFDGSPADRVVAIGARYGYRLADGDPPLEAYLPVLQSTSGPYDPATTVAEVTGLLQRWRGDNEPAAAGGLWAFWVSLWSSLDPGLDRPVLQLKRVVSMLAPRPGAAAVSRL